MKTNKCKLILLGAAFVSALGTGYAQDSGQDWKFSVTLPVWAAGLDGDVTVAGITQNVDIGFNDLKEHLDASASLGLEARKGPLAVYGSFGYLKFSADGPAPLGGSTHAESEFALGDFGVSRAFYKSDSDRPLILEALVGVRYIGLKNSVEVYNAANTLIFTGEKRHDLIDPIIGLRGKQVITEKLHADFSADVGGFGISDNQSDLDWSVIAVASYDFTDWFTLSAGYKILAVDASNGAAGVREVGVDVAMSGAIIAAKFSF